MNQIRKTMISIYLRKTNKIFSAAVIALFLIPIGAFAQESQSLSVSPTIFEMTANPGQVWQSTLRVINPNPYDLRLYTDVVNFRPLGEKGASEFIPIAEDSSEPATFAEWIDVPDGQLLVPAEQTLQIPIIINVPENAPPGGHFAAVLVGTRAPESGAGQVETAQVVSSLLFLRISGDIIESGNIRSFRTTSRLLDRPQATFELRFENKGNVHLQPQGEIVIKNMWGQERGTIPVNQRTLFGNVLPNSVRNYSFTWTGEWSPSDIGLYNAEVVLAYGEEQRQSVFSSTSFWLMPWKIVGGTLLAILVTLVLVTWLIKIYVRHMLSAAGITATSGNYGTKQYRVPSKKVSVVAPIEAGILDLRSRLQERKSNTAVIGIVLKYIQHYKLFFIGALLALLVLYVLFGFFRSVLVEKRDFEVSIDTPEAEIIINSEQIEFDELMATTTAVTEVKSTPGIEIVNRSGISGAAARLGSRLVREGYTIEKVSTEFGSIEQRTVIVYDPEFSEASLELSAALENALLSAYQNRTIDETPMIIYLGADIAE